MRKTVKRMLACLLASAAADKEITMLTRCGTHGSAKRLNRRTAIVSVFASEARTKWNCDRKDVLYGY